MLIEHLDTFSGYNEILRSPVDSSSANVNTNRYKSFSYLGMSSPGERHLRVNLKQEIIFSTGVKYFSA